MEPSLCVDRGHRPFRGGRHGLSIDSVGDLTGGKDARMGRCRGVVVVVMVVVVGIIVR